MSLLQYFSPTIPLLTCSRMKWYLIPICMLGSAVELRILSHTNSGLVIFKDYCWSSWPILQIRCKLPHPDSFLNCTGQRHILSFCCWESDAHLLLAPPTNCCPTNLKQISRSWLSIVDVTRPMCIRVPHSRYSRLYCTVDQDELYLWGNVGCALQQSIAGVGTKLCYTANGVSDIRPCPDWQVKQTSHCWLIEGLIHSFWFVSQLYRLCSSINRCIDWLRVLHTKFLQNILYVCWFTNPELFTFVILNDLNTQKIV